MPQPSTTPRILLSTKWQSIGETIVTSAACQESLDCAKQVPRIVGLRQAGAKHSVEPALALFTNRWHAFVNLVAHNQRDVRLWVFRKLRKGVGVCHGFGRTIVVFNVNVREGLQDRSSSKLLLAGEKL
jgi:hypothetical protein